MRKIMSPALLCQLQVKLFNLSEDVSKWEKMELLVPSLINSQGYLRLIKLYM